MEIYKLGSLYHMACSRMHDVIDDLYESIHNNSGSPIDTIEGIESAMDGVKNSLYQELDLIKSAVDEYQHQSIS